MTAGTASTSSTNASAVQDIQSELVDVGATLVSGCCQQQCLLSLTPKAILASHRKLNSLTSNAKRQWVTDKVFESSASSQQGKIEIRFSFSGVSVCNTAWCKIHQISQRQPSRVTRNVAQGLVNVQHGNKGKKRNNAKSDVAKTWMDRYFYLVGNKMPHSEQIHFPSWDTQKDVYLRYCSDIWKSSNSHHKTLYVSAHFTGSG